jgi:hypothetical protein
MRLAINHQELCKCGCQNASISIVSTTIKKIRQQFDDCDEGSSILRCHLTKDHLNIISKISRKHLQCLVLQSIQGSQRHDLAHLILPCHSQIFFEGNEKDIKRDLRSRTLIERIFDERIVNSIDSQLVCTSSTSQHSAKDVALSGLEGRNVPSESLLESD